MVTTVICWTQLIVISLILLHSESDKKAIKLLKYVLNDYRANCEKPSYYMDANKPTPYGEYIVPIFKYLSAVYKNLSFVW